MTMSGHNNETLTFHLIHSLQQPIILVYGWFRRHNPHMDWTSGTEQFFTRPRQRGCDLIAHMTVLLTFSQEQLLPEVDFSHYLLRRRDQGEIY